MRPGQVNKYKIAEFIVKLSEINREKVLVRWRKVHSAEQEYISTHARKNEPLNARIHGYLCGDGSVSIRKERRTGKMHHEIRFYPDHRSMAFSFINAFHLVYGKRLRLKERKNHFLVNINSKVIVNDLLRDGSFSSTGWRVPHWVMHNQENAREWLRAFFDSEAHVNNREIRVQSVNMVGLRQVKSMLVNLGVVCREYSYERKNKNWNVNYHLVISRHTNRYNFLKRVGFNHIKKLSRLLNADVA